MKLYKRNEYVNSIIVLIICVTLSILLTYFVLIGRLYSTGIIIYVYLVLSWAFSIFVFILCGYRSIQWCIIDDEGVSSYCIFKKFKSYKWKDIKTVRLEKFFTGMNPKTGVSEVLVFYNGQEKNMSIGVNSSRKPIICYTTTENIKKIATIIKSHNIRVQNYFM